MVSLFLEQAVSATVVVAADTAISANVIGYAYAVITHTNSALVFPGVLQCLLRLGGGDLGEGPVSLNLCARGIRGGVYARVCLKHVA